MRLLEMHLLSPSFLLSLSLLLLQTTAELPSAHDGAHEPGRLDFAYASKPDILPNGRPYNNAYTYPNPPLHPESPLPPVVPARPKYPKPENGHPNQLPPHVGLPPPRQLPNEPWVPEPGNRYKPGREEGERVNWKEDSGSDRGPWREHDREFEFEELQQRWDRLEPNPEDLAPEVIVQNDPAPMPEDPDCTSSIPEPSTTLSGCCACTVTEVVTTSSVSDEECPSSTAVVVVSTVVESSTVVVSEPTTTTTDPGDGECDPEPTCTPEPTSEECDFYYDPVPTPGR